MMAVLGTGCFTLLERYDANVLLYHVRLSCLLDVYLHSSLFLK
jgi:hypothetical protein